MLHKNMLFTRFWCGTPSHSVRMCLYLREWSFFLHNMHFRATISLCKNPALSATVIDEWKVKRDKLNDKTRKTGTGERHHKSCNCGGGCKQLKKFSFIFCFFIFDDRFDFDCCKEYRFYVLKSSNPFCLSIDWVCFFMIVSVFLVISLTVFSQICTAEYAFLHQTQQLQHHCRYFHKHVFPLWIVDFWFSLFFYKKNVKILMCFFLRVENRSWFYC